MVMPAAIRRAPARPPGVGNKGSFTAEDAEIAEERQLPKAFPKALAVELPPRPLRPLR